jgi:hypothetical protein
MPNSQQISETDQLPNVVAEHISSAENQPEYRMPLILWDKGRVDGVVFPLQTLEHPPYGVKVKQLKLLEDAGNFGVLRKIRYPDSVARCILYYSTNITGRQMAEDEGITSPTVYASIRNTMRAIHC